MRRKARRLWKIGWQMLDQLRRAVEERRNKGMQGHQEPREGAGCEKGSRMRKLKQSTDGVLARILQRMAVEARLRRHALPAKWVGGRRCVSRRWKVPLHSMGLGTSCLRRLGGEGTESLQAEECESVEAKHLRAWDAEISKWHRPELDAVLGCEVKDEGTSAEEEWWEENCLSDEECRRLLDAALREKGSEDGTVNAWAADWEAMAQSVKHKGVVAWKLSICERGRQRSTCGTGLGWT